LILVQFGAAVPAQSVH